MSLYLALDLGSLAVPLLFSFHPKLKFYKEFRFIIPGILISMLFFVAWDAWFTYQGVWGFNEEFLLGLEAFKLPLEEWLFFICIPYACLFTHHCIHVIFPNLQWPSEKTSRVFALLLFALCAILVFIFYDRLYTVCASLLAMVTLMVTYRYSIGMLKSFIPTYLLILIPFCIVNGVLTGYMTHEPVVWYNDEENMAMRFLTIPWEDFIYNFSLLFIPLLISSRLKEKSSAALES